MNSFKNEVSGSLFGTVLRSIDSADSVVSQTWLETVLDIIRYIPKEILETEAVPFALSKAHISRPAEQRVTSCHIFGGIVPKLEADLLKKDVVPTVQSLCQDVSPEVRAAACRLLPLLYERLKNDPTDATTSLFPFLIELTNDEDINVCLESFETVISIIPSLKNDTVVTIILPILQNMFKRCFTERGPLVLTASNYFGRLFSLLEGIYGDEDKKCFLQHYVSLSRLNLLDYPISFSDSTIAENMTERCHYYCATAFITIASYCKNEDQSNSLYAALTLLSQDQYAVVRSTIAGFFDKVSQTFQKFGKSVLDIFLNLLMDTEECVRLASLHHISAVFSDNVRMKIIGRHINDNLTSCCLSALIKLIESCVRSSKWRSTVSLLEHIQNVCKHFPTNILSATLAHCLFANLNASRHLPCRIEIVTTILVILNECSIKEEKEALMRRVIRDLCSSQDFYNRSLFVHVCPRVLKTVTCPQTREQFLCHLVNLADDAVINIRISLCIVVPELMEILTSSNNCNCEEEKEAVMKIVSALEHERHKSVAEQVKIMQNKLTSLQNKGNATVNSASDHIAVEMSSSPVDINSNNLWIKTESAGALDYSMKMEQSVQHTCSTKVPNQRRNSWITEEDFFIDAGISIKNTGSTKIPLLNSLKSHEVSCRGSGKKILQRPKSLHIAGVPVTCSSSQVVSNSVNGNSPQDTGGSDNGQDKFKETGKTKHLPAVHSNSNNQVQKKFANSENSPHGQIRLPKKDVCLQYSQYSVHSQPSSYRTNSAAAENIPAVHRLPLNWYQNVRYASHQKVPFLAPRIVFPGPRPQFQSDMNNDLRSVYMGTCNDLPSAGRGRVQSRLPVKR